MLLQINFKSGVPVYLQIVDQIKRAAASGSIQPGEAIPSIRPLSEELRVNRNTVAKAYEQLESQGVIVSLPGKGCFLAENHSPLKLEIRRQMVAGAVDAALVEAHHLQIDRDTFLNIVKDRMEHFEASELTRSPSKPATGTKPQKP